ncbi:MAG: InlB B-repeat-containing protein [Treponema sp.]|jgi:uncharacterized repeat protein (TIGR02543 family)|nr:InlB B-repeat-containing protein [Treponema sp.]
MTFKHALAGWTLLAALAKKCRGLTALLPVTALLQGCAQPLFPSARSLRTAPAREPAVYTVTFDRNGGDTDAVPPELTLRGPGATVRSLPEPPRRTGYLFDGWNTAQDGTGSGFDRDTPVNGSLTVYARWKILAPAGGITLSPQPEDPEVAGATVIAADETAAFAVGGTAYQSYQWHWDGMPIEGATTSSYILDAGTQAAGTYEISVVVTTAEGDTLSDRIQIVIQERTAHTQGGSQ